MNKPILMNEEEKTTAGTGRVVALSGGIGGAKLALGLKHALPADALTVIANTGDDFEHLGLAVSPDIDTLVYTLSGRADTTRGWGRQDETWHFMAALEELGGAAWFSLGDRDLAMHVWRTGKLAAGETLANVTTEACRRLAVGATILPMSDQAVRTKLATDEGWLNFQDYFVARRAGPPVTALDYEGAVTSKPADGVIEALTDEQTSAIVICPSNPLISIEPILAVPGITDAIKSAAAPTIAVSPIIGGKAIKGPTAKMLVELGIEATAESVLARYGDLIDIYLVDPADADACAETAAAHGVEVVAADIMMTTLDHRIRLAHAVLNSAARRTSSIRRPGIKKVDAT